MSNLIIVYKFRSDTAALSLGNWFSEFPLTNLQKMPLSKYTKSKGVTLPDTKFGITMNPIRACQVLALCRHNFNQNAKVRIRAGTTSLAQLSNTTLLYNMQVDTLPAGVSVTRAGVATRVNSLGNVVAVSANVARMDYNPTSLIGNGLLIEPAGTNSLLRSEAFDNASWTKTAASIGTDTTEAASPDGANGAEKVTEDGTNALHCAFQSATIVAASVNTFSIFLKYAGRQHYQLVMDNGSSQGVFMNVDLVNGIVTRGPEIAGTGGSPTGGIVRYQNGWYRVWLSGTIAPAATSCRCAVVAISSGTVGLYPSFAGSASTYLWGAQLEAGNMMTSYIPTAGSTVTRNSDSAVTITAPAGTYDRIITRSGSVATDVYTSAGTFTVTANGTDYYIQSISLTPQFTYDSGWIDAWPAIYDSDLLEWEDDNWWEGKLLAEDAVGYPINFIHVMPTPVYAGYWLVEIDDQLNTSVAVTATDISAATSDDSFNSVAGAFGTIGVGQTIVVSGFANAGNNGSFTVTSATAYKVIVSANLVNESAGPSVTITTGNSTIGRLVLGPVFQPKRNHVYGAGLKYDPKSAVNETKNGTTYARNFSNVREFDFAFDMLEKSEALGGVLDIQLRKGDFGDILVIPDPDDDLYMHVRAFLAKMRELSPAENVNFDVYGTAFRVRETK